MFTGKIDVENLETRISEFLAWESMSRDTIDVKRVYCDIAGDLVAGVLLSQIIYWHLPDRNGDPRLSVDRDGHLWLAKSYADWWNECRVTQKQARRATQVLAERKIIQVGKWQFNGAPTTHIRLNWPEFLIQLEKATGKATEKVAAQFRSAQRANRSAQKANRPVQRANRSSQKGKSLTENTSETTSETTSEIDSGVGFEIEDDDDDESHRPDSSSSVHKSQKQEQRRPSKAPKALVKAVATWTDLRPGSKKVVEAASIIHTEGLGHELNVQDWVERSWPDERPSNATRRRPWPSQVVDGLRRRKEANARWGYYDSSSAGDVCAECGAAISAHDDMCPECGRELEPALEEG